VNGKQLSKPSLVFMGSLFCIYFLPVLLVDLCARWIKVWSVLLGNVLWGCIDDILFYIKSIYDQTYHVNKILPVPWKEIKCYLRNAPFAQKQYLFFSIWCVLSWHWSWWIEIYAIKNFANPTYVSQVKSSMGFIVYRNLLSILLPLHHPWMFLLVNVSFVWGRIL
jgi:hypothetical protein